MRRRGSVVLALVIAASAACTSIKQEAFVVDPTVPTSTSSAPKTAVEGTTFRATTLKEFHGGSVVTIPNDGGKDEAAIHALAPSPDGWIAAGSITKQPHPGWAAV